MFLLKKLINFFYKSLVILIITFFLSLGVDYLLGKKILKLIDGYLVKTQFYGRLLRVDNSIYHHGFMPNVNYKNNAGFQGKFTICTNNHGFRDSCGKKNINKNFDIAFMGDSFVEGYSVNFEGLRRFSRSKRRRSCTRGACVQLHCTELAREEPVAPSPRAPRAR